MSGFLLKSTVRAVGRLYARNLHTSTACFGQIQLTQEQKDKMYPILGILFFSTLDMHCNWSYMSPVIYTI